MKGDELAQNFSKCVDEILFWTFEELRTYEVKLVYGDFADTFLNTTLFLQNTSIALSTCTDATENLYWYALYQGEKFGSWLEWSLALLQNLLGNVLRLYNISNALAEDTSQDDAFYLYYAGTIARMILIFDPIEEDLSLYAKPDWLIKGALSH